MFSKLRRVFRPNAHSRRVLSGLCAAFVLATIAFSSVFLAAEADHDCQGYDCPTCLKMQACVANLELVGSSTTPCGCSIPETTLSTAETVPCARRAPATTLQSLDVRFDE